MRIQAKILLCLLFLILVGCEQAALSEPVPAVAPSATPLVGVGFVTVAPPTAVSILQFTPTPLPTPTATPLPTPISYTVGEGDTLYDIAFFNGTTVEEILAINQQISADFLSIGQSLILPPPSAPINQTQSATPLPTQLSISSLVLYETPVGSTWVMGMVRNDGASAAERVRVQVDLIDAAGATVEQVMAESAVSLIPPQTTAPFSILLNEPAPNIDAIGTAIVSGNSAISLGNRYLNVSVSDFAQTSEGNHISVNGILKNEGEQTASNLILHATFLDAQNNIAGYYTQRLDGTLNTIQELPFQFTATPPNNQVSQILFQVEALTN